MIFYITKIKIYIEYDFTLNGGIIMSKNLIKKLRVTISVALNLSINYIIFSVSNVHSYKNGSWRCFYEN